jgi:hypothetical protein
MHLAGLSMRGRGVLGGKLDACQDGRLITRILNRQLGQAIGSGLHA